jgi:hypothetical protein
MNVQSQTFYVSSGFICLDWGVAATATDVASTKG